MSFSLFLSNLKLGRWGILSWTVLIFLYALLTMYLYPSFAESNVDLLEYINGLPEALKAAFGYEGIDFTSATFTPEAFATLEFLVMWPLLIGTYGLFSSVGIAREAERGTLDLLLAQPIKRYKVLISKFSVFIFAAVLIAVVSYLGLVAGAAMIDEPVDSGSLAMVLFEALLMVLAIASITLLCSVVFLDPRKSLLVSGLIVGVSYIINFMVPILDPAIEWLRNTSIFYFYQPNEIVESGSLDAIAIAVYTVIILVCFFASLVLFQRRDITV